MSESQSISLIDLPWYKWNGVEDRSKIKEAALVRLTGLPDAEDMVDFVFDAHDGQFRDKGNTGSRVPYAIHPIAVAIGSWEPMREAILAHNASPDKVEKAAVLTKVAAFHDIVEECSEKWTEKILRKYGRRVFNGVWYLSEYAGDKYEYLNRADRKDLEVSRYMYMPFPFALIKMDDRLQNLHTWPENDPFAFGNMTRLQKETIAMLAAIHINAVKNDHVTNALLKDQNLDPGFSKRLHKFKTKRIFDRLVEMGMDPQSGINYFKEVEHYIFLGDI